MWQDGVNERGEPLKAFEREALVKRHCELFGRWPEATAEADDPRTIVGA
jgi:hypothetical protein